jgi:hypothetical protein
MQAEAGRQPGAVVAEGKASSSGSTGIQLWQLVSLGAGWLVGGGVLASYSTTVAALAGVAATLLAWVGFQLYFVLSFDREAWLTRVIERLRSARARTGAGPGDAAFFLAVIVLSIFVAAAVTWMP